MIDCIDMALAELKKTDRPEVKICSSSAYWIPLQWLYDKLVKNNDLQRLDKIPADEKQRLWMLAKSNRPDKNNFKDRWVLVMICQAIHAYENTEK